MGFFDLRTVTSLDAKKDPLSKIDAVCRGMFAALERVWRKPMRYASVRPAQPIVALMFKTLGPLSARLQHFPTTRSSIRSASGFVLFSRFGAWSRRRGPTPNGVGCIVVRWRRPAKVENCSGCSTVIMAPAGYNSRGFGRSWIASNVAGAAQSTIRANETPLSKTGRSARDWLISPAKLRRRT